MTPRSQSFFSALAALFATFIGVPTAAAETAAPAVPDYDRPYSSCSLMLGEAYKQSPLPGFDPTDTSQPLVPPSPELKAQIVVCIRNSIVPALNDYRVLSEMNLPLFIRAKGRILELATLAGRLHVTLIGGATLSPAEVRAVNKRLGQMEAMYQSPRAPVAPAVDLAKAYAPADLALLLGIIAKAGIPGKLDFVALQMPESTFAGCAEVRPAFIRAVSARLNGQGAALQAEMASGFDPPFTHDDLVVLDRFYQLTPIFVAPNANGLPSGKPLSAAEGVEAAALAKNPAVGRFLDRFPRAMTKMMEHVGLILTAALHETCPAMRDQQIHSTGLQSVTKGAGLPSP